MIEESKPIELFKEVKDIDLSMSEQSEIKFRQAEVDLNESIE